MLLGERREALVREPHDPHRRDRVDGPRTGQIRDREPAGLPELHRPPDGVAVAELRRPVHDHAQRSEGLALAQDDHARGLHHDLDRFAQRHSLRVCQPTEQRRLLERRPVRVPERLYRLRVVGLDLGALRHCPPLGHLRGRRVHALGGTASTSDANDLDDGGPREFARPVAALQPAPGEPDAHLRGSCGKFSWLCRSRGSPAAGPRARRGASASRRPLPLLPTTAHEGHSRDREQESEGRVRLALRPRRAAACAPGSQRLASRGLPGLVAVAVVDGTEGSLICVCAVYWFDSSDWSVLDALGVPGSPWLAGYRIKVLDGNHLAATERRLKVLRDCAAGPLPGQSLVVLEPETGLATQMVGCEDGHAQERSLLDRYSTRCGPRTCTSPTATSARSASCSASPSTGDFFVVRQHGQLPVVSEGTLRRRGRIDSGELFEQTGHAAAGRRVSADTQDRPATRHPDAGRGHRDVDPDQPGGDVASATVVADLYRRRWSVESLFARVERNLQSELALSAYPGAAVFAFAVALLRATSSPSSTQP